MNTKLVDEDIDLNSWLREQCKKWSIPMESSIEKKCLSDWAKSFLADPFKPAQ